jgi:hypothetical protein
MADPAQAVHASDSVIALRPSIVSVSPVSGNYIWTPTKLLSFVAARVRGAIGSGHICDGHTFPVADYDCQAFVAAFEMQDRAFGVLIERGASATC